MIVLDYCNFLSVYFPIFMFQSNLFHIKLPALHTHLHMIFSLFLFILKNAHYVPITSEPLVISKVSILHTFYHCVTVAYAHILLIS